MSELQPCLNCKRAVIMESCIGGPKPQGPWWVVCAACEMYGPHMGTRAEAVAAWNALADYRALAQELATALVKASELMPNCVECPRVETDRCDPWCQFIFTLRDNALDRGKVAGLEVTWPDWRRHE